MELEVVQVGDEHVTYSITEISDNDGSDLLQACTIEIHTCGDMAIVDPFSRRRLWIASALDQATNIYDAAARTIAVAKELKFLGDPDKD